MVFKYTVIQGDSKERGIITAETMADAEALLRERHVTILNVEAVNSSVGDSPYYHLAERSAGEKLLARLLISGFQVELALGQLAALLDGGVPILTAVQTVAAQSGHFLSRALFCMANKLQVGIPLPRALREEMPFLGNVILGLISAGEANGDIDKMCTYSMELLARRRKLRGQILQAMAYPALVVAATAGIVVFLMVQVIPKIMNFLNARSTQLPPVTQALVDSTHFLQANGIYIVLFPFLLALVIMLLRKNPGTVVAVDRLALRIPLFGKLLRDSNNTLWCRTLGILLRSGINIIPALELTRGSLENGFYRSELAEMKNIISQGHPLSTALQVSPLKPFIPLVEAMLVVGESTGHVDEGLLKVAEFCDLGLQRRITLLSKMIEPVLFLTVGSIVGFVYIAFFMGLMAASTGK